MKNCFKCYKRLSLAKFYKHSKMKDGHLNKCIECTKKDALKTRSKNIHYYREYDRKRGWLTHRLERAREYRKTTAGKLSQLKANRKYRQSNNIKYQCHNIVQRAIRNGTIIKKPCKKCGDNKSVAHHKNYFEPFKIMWFCDYHHKEWHKSHKNENQF